MILSVDSSLALPVYEQVREQIRRVVLAGTLAPGTRLPTIRQLASDLGVAKGTIERAYELLEADRLIQRQGRHGTIVAERSRADQPAITAGMADAAARLVVVARQLGATEGETLRAVRAAWQAM